MVVATQVLCARRCRWCASEPRSYFHWQSSTARKWSGNGRKHCLEWEPVCTVGCSLGFSHLTMYFLGRMMQWSEGAHGPRVVEQRRCIPTGYVIAGCVCPRIACQILLSGVKNRRETVQVCILSKLCPLCEQAQSHARVKRAQFKAHLRGQPRNRLSLVSVEHESAEAAVTELRIYSSPKI